jgi:uncharacterized membrane protein
MARYKNLFNRYVERGSEYMENFGKPAIIKPAIIRAKTRMRYGVRGIKYPGSEYSAGRGRKIRSDEFIDGAGYIRRSRQSIGGGFIIWLIVLLALVALIVTYWKIILISILIIAGVFTSVFVCYRLVKRHKKLNDEQKAGIKKEEEADSYF